MKKFCRRKNSASYWTILILIILLITSIGYAIFTEELEINGIVSGNANFKVYFIDAWAEDNTKGTATINTQQGSDTVTYTANLSYPGDRVLIGTKIKNESSVAVKLNDFTPTNISNNSDIKFDYIDLDGIDEILGAGEICDYEFVVYWGENSENANPTQVTFEIQLDYEQYTESNITSDVTTLHSHWSQNGTTVTNGNVTLEVGSAIVGYEANSVLDWYVLGVENGKLLITTNYNVENVRLNGADGYINGISRLNEVAENYKDATYAYAARAINVDDINRVTGYNPDVQNYNNGTENINQCGNKVTYTMKDDGYIWYKGTKYPTEETVSDSTSFRYWNGNEWKTLQNGESSTFTNTKYIYSFSSIYPSGSEIWKLFLNNTAPWHSSYSPYWLASQSISTYEEGVSFGLRIMRFMEYEDYTLFKTNDYTSSYDYGMRPVIYLKSDVNISSEGVILN